jgi:hypothetical protein
VTIGAAATAASSHPNIDPQRSVFINCPYDDEYEQLFDALLLTVVTCGFVPRSALESGSVSASRMDRIFTAIDSSDFSIHDLSRCHGEGEALLARFNMPLELGIAMSCRRHAGRHDWFVLVPTDAPYARFVSDLTGFDLQRYDGKEDSIVQNVMGWLVTFSQALPAKPSDVLNRLGMFRKKKAELKAEWNQIPWRHLVETATQVAAGPPAAPNHVASGAL